MNHFSIPASLHLIADLPARFIRSSKEAVCTLLPFFAIVWLASSCATTPKSEVKNLQLPPPPAITSKTSTDDLVSLAIEYGGETLQKVKKQVRTRQIYREVESQLIPILKVSSETLADHQLLNAAHLYSFLPSPLNPELFTTMVDNDRLIARRVAWQLAATKPDAKIARLMDRSLTQALVDDNLNSVLLPQMANAVRSNKLQSAYTVVRQGLMLQGDEEYALAMMALNPNRASQDFFPYLLLAPPEELRQLSVSSVKVYTVITVLRHLKNYPTSPGTLGFDQIFAYAVSRNNAVSDLARSVLEAYLPVHAATLAIGLAKQPPWLQVAFLENVRRQSSPGLVLLLRELKQTTSESLIAKEIDEIRD